MERNAAQRIIVALDGMTSKKIRETVNALRDHVWGFKFNDALYNPLVPEDEATLIGALYDDEDTITPGIMGDAKLRDIPRTMARSVKKIAQFADFITVHAENNAQALQYAADAANEEGVNVIGITVLTSWNLEDMIELGIVDEEIRIWPKEAQAQLIENRVLRLALHAKKNGLHGIVCSGHEAKVVKEKCGDDFITICPGINPLWKSQEKDQSRVMTPAKAIANGADFLVIGSAITGGKTVDNMVARAKAVAQEIETGVQLTDCLGCFQ